MKYCVFVIICSVLLSVSCQESTEKDYSLSIEELIDQGMPNPNMNWDSEDIMEAMNVLYSIKWEQPYSLPKKSSDKTGLLFDRMITLENMTFLSDDTLHLRTKAFSALNFLHTFTKWSDVYTYPMWKRQYYHRELVDISVNEVRVAEIMVDLTKQVEASTDPEVIPLQAGIPDIKMNYLSSMINALDLQSHTSQFLQKDLEIMSDSLSASVLRNRGWMDTTHTDPLKESVQVVLDSTTSDYITNKYTALISSL